MYTKQTCTLYMYIHVDVHDQCKVSTLATYCMCITHTVVHVISQSIFLFRVEVQNCTTCTCTCLQEIHYKVNKHVLMHCTLAYHVCV